MRIRKPGDCEIFEAGDDSLLYVLFSPLNESRLPFRYSLAHATVSPGQKTKLHRMKTSEIYYILDGTGLMYIDGEVSIVEKGYVVDIPPNSKQQIENVGEIDLEFLCIVDPYWKPEDEIIEE